MILLAIGAEEGSFIEGGPEKKTDKHVSEELGTKSRKKEATLPSET